MSKKIGAFLMIILVIWAVLLLDATKNRQGAQTSGDVPGPTGAPAESISGETTNPEIMPSETHSADADCMEQTEQLLASHSLNRTAVTHMVRNGAVLPAKTTTAALAELAARQPMNPVAAFWLLEEEGLYVRTGEQAGLPAMTLPEPPEQTAKQYPYTDAGARELLTELLSLAGTLGSQAAQPILGEDGTVEPGLVFLSEQEHCRYVYFAHRSKEYAQLLCFYLRSDDAGVQITDVEFQLLDMRCGSDGAQSTAEAAALAAAAELLLTGSARAGSEEAASYEVGGWTAAAERFFFTANTEQGSLTNYRLRDRT